MAGKLKTKLFVESAMAAWKWISFERKNIKSESMKAAKFIAVFVLVFVALSAVVSMIPLQLFEMPVAIAIKGFFAGQGIDAVITPTEPVLLRTQRGVNVSVSYLCTGVLESIVWIAIISASLGIERRKRIAGIFYGLAGIASFNLVRIFITLLIALNADTNTVEFIHNVLFRVTLFIVIVGFYGIWFWLSIKSSLHSGIQGHQSPKKEQNPKKH